MPAYQRLVARLDYPMYVVTTAAADDGERSGCLVGFVTQCSIHPPRHAVWLSEKNHTARVARRARGLVVHTLSAANRDLAEWFGALTGDDVDKFAAPRVLWHDGPLDLPVLDGTAGWFAGRTIDRLPPTGDHHGYVLEPVEAWLPAGGGDDRELPALGFQSLKHIDAGHAP